MGDDPFEEIVASLKHEMPYPDPHVSTILVDGTVLDFREVNAKQLGYRLLTRGFAELADEKGAYCILMAHGVSAIVARKEPA